MESLDPITVLQSRVVQLTRGKIKSEINPNTCAKQFLLLLLFCHGGVLMI